MSVKEEAEAIAEVLEELQAGHRVIYVHIYSYTEAYKHDIYIYLKPIRYRLFI